MINNSQIRMSYDEYRVAIVPYLLAPFMLVAEFFADAI